MGLWFFSLCGCVGFFDMKFKTQLTFYAAITHHYESNEMKKAKKQNKNKIDRKPSPITTQTSTFKPLEMFVSERSVKLFHETLGYQLLVTSPQCYPGMYVALTYAVSTRAAESNYSGRKGLKPLFAVL